MCSLKNSDSQAEGWNDVSAERSGSVRHCVQSERGGVLLGPQTQVLDAGGLIVVAGEAARRRGLQQRAVPHLLGVMGQRLVVGLAGQGAQRRRRHVDIHSQVRERGRGGEVEGRVVHQVVGGSHVLAELLLQTEEAERGGGVRVALREGSAAGQATAGGGGGGHGWRDQGRIWRDRSAVRDAVGPGEGAEVLKVRYERLSPALGLSLLHTGETSSGVAALSHFSSSA